MFVVLHVETDNSYEVIEKRLLLKINDTINTAWAHFFKKCFKVSIVYEGTEKRCKSYVEKLRQNEKITRMFVDSNNFKKESPNHFKKESIENLQKSTTTYTDSHDYTGSVTTSYNDYMKFKDGVNSSSTFNNILRQSTYLLTELSEKSATLSHKISSISTPSKFSKNSSVVNENEYKLVNIAISN